MYSDRGSHFWLTPKAGGKVDPHRLTQVGRALRELGVQMIPAYSPQARGRSERNFGTWQGRLPQELRLRGIGSAGSGEQLSARALHRRVQPALPGGGGAAGSAFVPCRRRDLDLVFSLQFERAVNRDNTVSFQNLRCRSSGCAGEATLAGCNVDGASASGWNAEPHPRAAPAGTFHRPGRAPGAGKPAASCGKDAGGKVKKTTFHPAWKSRNCAGFPLSHSCDGCGRLTSNRTYHVLQKPDILTCYEQTPSGREDSD